MRREWNPTEPNRLSVADITYIRTWEGWLYLAAALDCHSRRCVGWSIADHLRAEIVVDAVEMAVSRRRPEPGLIHHSDHGSQLGFKGSSQHPDVGGVYESSTWLGEGVDREGSDTVARPAGREPRIGA